MRILYLKNSLSAKGRENKNMASSPGRNDGNPLAILTKTYILDHLYNKIKELVTVIKRHKQTFFRGGIENRSIQQMSFHDEACKGAHGRSSNHNFDFPTQYARRKA